MYILGVEIFFLFRKQKKAFNKKMKIKCFVDPRGFHIETSECVCECMCSLAVSQRMLLLLLYGQPTNT